MARCRVEYIFGNLIDRGETEESTEKLNQIKVEFQKYGIQLPLIQGKRDIELLTLSLDVAPYPAKIISVLGTNCKN